MPLTRATGPPWVTERAQAAQSVWSRELPGAQSVTDRLLNAVASPAGQSVAHAPQGRVARAAEGSVAPPRHSGDQRRSLAFAPDGPTLGPLARGFLPSLPVSRRSTSVVDILQADVTCAARGPG
jgi:hypothetical protein